MQEIPAKFASLDEDGISLARPAPVPPVSGCGTIDYRRIAARSHKDFGGHCRGGRLPMGSGDGQAAVPLHQPAEHFGIADDRNAELRAAMKFGIGGRNGAAIDHALNVRAHLVRRMPGKTANSRLRKRIVPTDHQIRAAQPPTLAEEDTRHGPHAGTPNAHQMGPLHPASFEGWIRACFKHWPARPFCRHTIVYLKRVSRTCHRIAARIVKIRLPPLASGHPKHQTNVISTAKRAVARYCWSNRNFKI